MAYNCSNCGCGSCGCGDCPGCPVILDFECVVYHKENNELSQLDGLGLSNGATLQLVIETLDEKIKGLNVGSLSLPCLRSTYTITSMQQFVQAVDTQLCILKGDIDDLVGAGAVALSVTDSSTIDFTASGTLNHTLTASVKLSANTGNRITSQTDGLHVAGQTLSVNYATKELTISGGNTVDLASLTCGASGFLGNLAADPTATDGQYWFNTTSSKLKIKVNGTVKEIVTA